MGMKKFTAIFCLTLLPMLAAQWVWAAVQGTLGPSSTMTLNVEIEIGREVRVFRLDPINLGVFDFNTAQTQGNDTFCVYDNGAAFPGMTYAISFNGTSTPGSFNLASGGNTIPYQVEYDDSQSGSNFRIAAPGVPLTGNINGSTGSGGCGSVGGNNGNVRITVTNAAAGGSPSGIYTDTLSILVEPD